VTVTQLAIQPFKYPPHPMCASALPGENGTREIGLNVNKNVKKTSPTLPAKVTEVWTKCDLRALF